MTMLNQVCHVPWKNAVFAGFYQYMLAPKTAIAAEPKLRPLKTLRICLANKRESAGGNYR
jgi:hypothetical protein